MQKNVERVKISPCEENHCQQFRKYFSLRTSRQSMKPFFAPLIGVLTWLHFQVGQSHPETSFHTWLQQLPSRKFSLFIAVSHLQFSLNALKCSSSTFDFPVYFLPNYFAFHHIILHSLSLIFATELTILSRD